MDWRSFAATASALLEGRPLASLPVVDCICKVTAEAWLAESYGRLSDGDDGSAELFRLIGAAAWPEGHPPSKENEAWAVGYLTAAVHSPLGAGPDRLIAAAAERMAPGNNDVPAEHLATVFTSGHADLQAGYRDAQFVAAMFSGLDKRGIAGLGAGSRLRCGDSGCRVADGDVPGGRTPVGLANCRPGLRRACGRGYAHRGGDVHPGTLDDAGRGRGVTRRPWAEVLLVRG